MRWWIVVLFVAGCVRTSTVTCPDGKTVCAADHVCAATLTPEGEEQTLCVEPQQVEACEGAEPFAECLGDGRCYDGVCQPAGCGNRRVDPDEVCDDGNRLSNDGCSADCISNETCGNNVIDRGEVCDDGNLRGHDGCTSTCTSEVLAWRETRGAPDARWQSAMAYDAARGRIVMFGGLLGGNPYLGGLDTNETWEWTGRGWVRIPTDVAPRARHGHAMTYDPARRVVVMFGGIQSDGRENEGTGVHLPLRDTWEWDGARWTERPSLAQPPSPRGHHAMAYDPRRAAIVLFGGDNDGDAQTFETYDDTWTWDGTRWQQLAMPAPRPAARTHASLVFDPSRDELVLTGGSQDFENQFEVNDTWKLQPTGWSLVTSTAPPPRSAVAYDPDGRRLLAVGGDNNGATSLTTTLAFDGSSWTQLAATVAPRQQLAIATDLARGQIVGFGGAQLQATPTIRSDTITWTGTSWKSDLVLLTRLGAGVAFDDTRRTAVVFGGSRGSVTADTYELDHAGWRQLTPTTSPPARMNHAMAHDEPRGEVVLFGGTVGTGSLGDTWTYNGVTWVARTPAATPSARSLHAMVHDRQRGRVLLHGGLHQGTTFSDTWEWDGTTWTQVAASGPQVHGHAMAYDPLRARVVLFGGTSGSSLAGNATWEWDGATWNEIATSLRPSGRERARLAWDPARGRLVLTGGVPLTDEVWEWDGTSWTSRTLAGPQARAGHVAISDPAGEGIVVVGGQGGSLLGDAWLLTATSVGAYETCVTDVDLDGDSLAGCDDPDCWGTCTPQCPPFTTCDPTSPRCGDMTCDPLRESSLLCPEDCTPVPVCGDFVCDAAETMAVCPGDCP